MGKIPQTIILLSEYQQKLLEIRNKYEQKINYQLNKYPRLKKFIKRGYQRTMYAISPKIKSEGILYEYHPMTAKNISSVITTSHHGMLQGVICFV